MKHTLLIDADIVAYKFAAKAQRETPFGIALDDLADVTPLVDEALEGWLCQLKATNLIICLSCPSAEGFRMEILPSYKGNRVNVVRPELLQPIKDYMEQKYPSYRRPSLEADDIMGILSTHPGIVPGRKTIVSTDKDMKTIPGWLFNPGKDTKPHLITEAEADRYHLYQTIIGDSTDGYDGCVGAGPDKAEKVLGGGMYTSYQHVFKSGPRKGQEETRWVIDTASQATPWQRVVALYERYGQTEADALVQARVARICRHTDYDFDNKKAIPWTPRPPQRGTASAAPTKSLPAKKSTVSTRSAHPSAAK